MTVNNISTLAAFQSTLTDVSKVEAELTKEQMQLSSGNAAETFADMPNQTQQFLSLDATLSKISQYQNTNKVIAARVDTTSSVLDQVISTTTSLQSLISQRRSGSYNNSAFSTQIQGMWQTLVGQLNTSINGQYLFSGSKTNVPAVNDSLFPTLQKFGVPDAGYYQGSDQDLTVRADDNITITYNVRADAPGFQKVFAGLAMAKSGDADNSDSELAQAYDLVQSGLQDVISTQATVNANKVALSTIDQNHTSLKLYWQGLQQSIGNTDVVSVSTQVAVNQGILQAAFQAFAKINSLHLSDFLK